MHLVQSYIFSVSRVKLSTLEQRILFKIVADAQVMAKDGLAAKKGRYEGDIDNVRCVVPLRDIISSKSSATGQVIEAIKSLEHRIMSYFDSAQNAWNLTPIIYNARYVVGSSQVTFYVSSTVLRAMLDFTKGFRQYDYDIVMSLSSAYAMRLYVLMAHSKDPITWSIPAIRKMFCLDDDYKQTRDLIKRVIETSKKLLDQKGCNTFEYRVNKKGRKIESLTFYPIKKEDIPEETLQSKVAVSLLISKQVYLILIHNASFTYQELSRNKKTLLEFQKLPECISILIDIINRSMTKAKPKGYIIAAMKSEILKAKL